MMAMVFATDRSVAPLADAHEIVEVDYLVQGPAPVREFGEIQLGHTELVIMPVKTGALLSQFVAEQNPHQQRAYITA